MIVRDGDGIERKGRRERERGRQVKRLRDKRNKTRRRGRKSFNYSFLYVVYGLTSEFYD